MTYDTGVIAHTDHGREARVSRFKFVHVGDVHIGKERLNGELPSSDFAKAFDEAVEVTIRERADFMLVAGDFFDRARIEPNHLAEAEPMLQRLAAARIPVVVIEGNHDVFSTYEQRPSWLTYLNQSGLAILLRTEFVNGAPQMKEWTPSDRTGNWISIAGARIIGAGWFGAATKRRLELLKEAITPDAYTILMLHAGINGMAEEFGMIDPGELAVIRDRVNYVALGHMHRKYVVDGYAHNPGALENWDLGEARYGDQKGLWAVEVEDGSHRASHVSVSRRPVHLAELPCDGLASGERLVEAVRNEARAWQLHPETVVRMKLTGVPAFNPGEINLPAVAVEIRESSGCKAVEVVASLGRIVSSTSVHDASLPREMIETEEIERLIRESGRYEGQVEIFRTLVRMVLDSEKGKTEELYASLRQAAAPILERDTHEDPEGPAR